MKKQVVRCFYCQRRYNVSGCMPGTRLRCGGCERILIVPKFRPAGRPRLWELQKPALLAAAGGFVVALGLFMVLARSGPSPSIAIHEPSPVSTVQTPPVRPSDPISADVLHSERWEKKLAGVRNELSRVFTSTDRFTFYRGSPFYIALERGHVALTDILTRDYLPKLQAVHQHLMAQFGRDLGWDPIQEPLTLIILNSKESFESYWTRVHQYPPLAEVKGDFSREHRWAVVYYDPPQGVQAAVHEMVHHVLDVYMDNHARNRIRPNAWFEEGLASYLEYEYLAYEDGKLDPEKLAANQVRIAELKGAELIPLSKFITLDARQISEYHAQADGGVRLQRIYAEACALIHFLRNDPLYRRQVTDYLGRYLKGEADADTFVKCFGDHQGVERDFRKFLQDKIH